MSKIQPPKQAVDALRHLGHGWHFTETTACRLIREYCKCSTSEAKAKFDALCQNNKIEKASRIGIAKSIQAYTLIQ